MPQRPSSNAPPSPPGRPAAFFDLDGTLLTVNSGRLWLLRERRAGRLRLRQAIRGVVWLALYRMGTIDIERAMSEALSTVRGLPEETLRGWTHEWFRSEVVPFTAPGAAAVIEAHRDAGHPLVLLTSSSPYASEVAVEHFGLDGYLSSHYEVEDGCFTGHFVRPLCFGAGKVARAEEWARGAGVDLDASWFYTDSATDLPMLERVGNPRPVHPDPRLRGIARAKSWPVLDWRAAAQEAAALG
jgi:HAD superfamily hydrolase (TIGR01490 family)